MGARVILPGCESVRCPVCRAEPGRPCHNRRGYLTKSHQARYELWMSREASEPF